MNVTVFIVEVLEDGCNIFLESNLCLRERNICNRKQQSEREDTMPFQFEVEIDKKNFGSLH